MVGDLRKEKEMKVRCFIPENDDFKIYCELATEICSASSDPADPAEVAVASRDVDEQPDIEQPERSAAGAIPQASDAQASDEMELDLRLDSSTVDIEPTDIGGDTSDPVDVGSEPADFDGNMTDEPINNLAEGNPTIPAVPLVDARLSPRRRIIAA